ncbi:MAG: hypothetical protein E5Y01_16345 [Mesorhizobium sp.]|uniref:hypothetical protein n=1 Tax=Mesorhizobium sp. TaxID=1871066 RepID=UPI0011FFB405|nr:hypothetical protein [Mesorhizobium sp.]TJV51156.1 MAG: hypothetical protein E5Y01_16345 [Mesorhizobium sp.]
MTTTVKKAFNTSLQRFKEGDEIADGADLSPHTVESLTEAGYLAGRPPVKTTAKPKTDDKPADDKPTEQ